MITFESGPHKSTIDLVLASPDLDSVDLQLHTFTIRIQMLPQKQITPEKHVYCFPFFFSRVHFQLQKPDRVLPANLGPGVLGDIQTIKPRSDLLIVLVRVVDAPKQTVLATNPQSVSEGAVIHDAGGRDTEVALPVPLQREFARGVVGLEVAHAVVDAV